MNYCHQKITSRDPIDSDDDDLSLIYNGSYTGVPREHTSLQYDFLNDFNNEDVNLEPRQEVDSVAIAQSVTLLRSHVQNLQWQQLDDSIPPEIPACTTNSLRLDQQLAQLHSPLCGQDHPYQATSRPSHPLIQGQPFGQLQSYHIPAISPFSVEPVQQFPIVGTPAAYDLNDIHDLCPSPNEAGTPFPTYDSNYGPQRKGDFQAHDGNIQIAFTQPPYRVNMKQTCTPKVAVDQGSLIGTKQSAQSSHLSASAKSKISLRLKPAIQIVENTYQKFTTHAQSKSRPHNVGQPVENTLLNNASSNCEQPAAPNKKKGPFLCPHLGRDKFPLLKSCFNNFPDKFVFKTHLEEHEEAECNICGDDENVTDVLAKHLKEGLRFTTNREFATSDGEKIMEDGHVQIPLPHQNDLASKWSYYSRLLFDEHGDTTHQHYLNINVKKFMREVLSFYHQKSPHWPMNGCRAGLSREEKEVFSVKDWKDLAFRFWLPHACQRSSCNDVKAFGEVLRQKNARAFPDIEILDIENPASIAYDSLRRKRQEEMHEADMTFIEAMPSRSAAPSDGQSHLRYKRQKGQDDASDEIL